MNTIELLTRQFEKYQEQNAVEHSNLNKKIDQLLELNNALVIQHHSYDKRLIKFENCLEEIKETVTELKQKQDERDHVRSWVVRGLGLSSVIIGIVIAVWKLGVF